jgi:hypothetical protein
VRIRLLVLAPSLLGNGEALMGDAGKSEAREGLAGVKPPRRVCTRYLKCVISSDTFFIFIFISLSLEGFKSLFLNDLKF